ncbi:virulence factor MviM [Desmospora sp. 8437]|nr:virulence factor MviM [Desmospora sp. 8437]
MERPKVGIIGLGNIAQKAYLPVLTKETDWELVGAFSPNRSKAQRICREYRIRDYTSLPDLLRDCHAVFVHTSTDSHDQVVSDSLKKGVDVYVDKPLASTVEKSQRLVELSEKTGRKLMVGFNRRFAPLYQKIKAGLHPPALIRLDKHRIRSSAHLFDFTLLDDYIHLIDTAIWLAGPASFTLHGEVKMKEDGSLLFANHIFSLSNDSSIHTAMHREAGTNMERLEAITDGKTRRVLHLETLEVEQDGEKIIHTPGAWEQVLKRRGFVDAVQHFVDSLRGDTPPFVDGREGIRAQELIEEIIQEIRKG